MLTEWRQRIKVYYAVLKRRHKIFKSSASRALKTVINTMTEEFKKLQVSSSVQQSKGFYEEVIFQLRHNGV